MLSLSLSNCSYNWGHSTRQLPGGHRTIFVEIFKNSPDPASNLVGIEHYFTQALRQEFARSGFAVVTSKNLAEVIVSGQIVSLGLQGGGAVGGFISTDYSNGTSQLYNAQLFTLGLANIVANLKLKRARDDKLIWQTSITGEDVYLDSLLKRQGVRSSNVLYNHSRKKQTVQLMAQAMMNEAFDRMTENF